MRARQDEPARLISNSHVRVLNCSADGCLLETTLPLAVNTVATLQVSFGGRLFEDVLQIVRCEPLGNDSALHHVAARFLALAAPYAGSLRYMMRKRDNQLAGGWLGEEGDGESA